MINLIKDNFSVLPSKCCGAIGSAINAAANTAISAMTNSVNMDIAKDANKTNLDITNATNEANERIQNSINETNQIIADKANALNYRMFVEENHWNEYMWQKQNAYNSPEAQMQRLIDAGINPNLIGSNGVAGMSGNSSSAPQSAQWVGAQVPTMNPVHLESGHVDPYTLVPFQADFLGAMATAAGIKHTQAETKGMEIANSFKPGQYADEHEMKTAATQHFLEMTKDMNETRVGRKELNSVLSGYYKELTKSWEQEIKQRKDAFEWSKSLRPKEEQKLEAQINEINAVVHKMGVEETVLEAQKNHWINEDQSQRIIAHATAKQADVAQQNANTMESDVKADNEREDALVENQIREIRCRIVENRLNSLFKSYEMGPQFRRRAAYVLAKDPDNYMKNAAEMVGGLGNGRAGSLNSFWGTVWHVSDALSIEGYDKPLFIK